MNKKTKLVQTIYRITSYCGVATNFVLRILAKFMSTLLALVVSTLFMVMTSYTFLEPSEGIYYTSAGIIGTALALVLTLSIIPAQRAADAFSTAILVLYGRDRVFTSVFFILATLTIFSVLLGSGWAFGLSAKQSVAVQVLALGFAFDAIRAFYYRSMELLMPRTALGLVQTECIRLINKNSRRIDKLAQIFQKQEQEVTDHTPVASWLLHTQSSTRMQLVGWIAQLEEFALKALSRRDLEATRSTIGVMATIARDYADSRRKSLVLVPNELVLLASPQSDVDGVLGPIYESIKRIFEQACRDKQEGTARACIQELGRTAAHMMTIITEDENPTAPLAHSPIFYLGECIKKTSNMHDVLLDAVRAVGDLFSKISPGVDTYVEESTAMDSLFSVASISYAEQAIVPAHQAVGMMMKIAMFELQVRGHRPGSMLQPVLKNIEHFVPFEFVMENLGKTTLQTLPPYSVTGDANAAGLLRILASQIAFDPESPRADPYHQFVGCSRLVVYHYRALAGITSNAGLLGYWIVHSCMDAAQEHINLIQSATPELEPYFKTIEDRLIWFIGTPEFFFKDASAFKNTNMVNKIPNRLAMMGIQLLQLGKGETATECCKALANLAKKSVALSPDQPYTTADMLTNVEVLARYAEEIDETQLAKLFRELKDIDISDTETLQAAILNRTGHLDKYLEQRRVRTIVPTAEAMLYAVLHQEKKKLTKNADRQAVSPLSERHDRILEAFERKKFQPLSVSKIARLTQISEKEIEDMMVSLGAFSSISKEGTKLWNLPQD